MFVEMSCKCGSAIQLDGVNDTYTLLMSNRFAESHISCGYVTPVAFDGPTTTKRNTNIKPKALQEDDED